MPTTTAAQIEHCNATGRQPVVFIHGLWLLASSWERWTTVFEEAGYAALAPGWPDDRETVADARRAPGGPCGQDGGPRSPTTSRRSSEGSSASRRSSGTPSAACWRRYLAGRGLSAVSVAIDPAPFQRRAADPDLGAALASCRCSQPAELPARGPLTYEQWRYAFANAVSEDEAQGAVPKRSPSRHRALRSSRRRPPTSTRSAETKVDRKNPERGPLSSSRERGPRRGTEPIPRASFKKQRRNAGVTEYVELAEPRARVDDRQRLARDRRHGARVRPALRVSLTDLRLLHRLARRRGNGAAAAGRRAAQDAGPGCPPAAGP